MNLLQEGLERRNASNLDRQPALPTRHFRDELVGALHGTEV